MAKARPIQGLDALAPTGNNARIIARVRLEEMYQWERYVDSPSHERELHNLRIAAKRLRYTLEIFEDVLPEACKPAIKELERIQEELGALHDSDVKIALLQRCLSRQNSGIPYKPTFLEAKQQHGESNTVGELSKKGEQSDVVGPLSEAATQSGDYLPPRQGPCPPDRVLCVNYFAPRGGMEANAAFALPPELLAVLLDPLSTPTAQQSRGLEQLLLKYQQSREEQYFNFRQYWHQLQARDFRSQLLSVLDT
jgi:CHAD domain